MEEEDLLGDDIHREQDLRLKIQRGPGGEGSSCQNQGGNIFYRGSHGGRDHGGTGRGHDFRAPEGNQQGAHGNTRGQAMGRDLDRVARNPGEDLGKGFQVNRGGQGTQGNWRPKAPAKDKNYYQEGKALEIKCFRCLESRPPPI